ncbi:MAG: calcium-binding protein [Albidovulum sp.]
MTLSAEEQYMLELINRARLDPDAEAQRQGIDLNDGLAAGTISSTAKGVLAPNVDLEFAAETHTSWMLANDTYGHVGENDWVGRERVLHSGYSNQTYYWGENVTAIDMATASSQTEAVDQLFSSLMLNVTDPNDRVAVLFYSASDNQEPREIGLGLEFQSFTISTLSEKPPLYGKLSLGGLSLDQAFNAALLTINYGKENVYADPADVFLTGVAYSDADHDGFYSIGEGLAGVGFAIGANATATAAAGGYALKLAPGAGVGVTVTAAGGAVSEVLADLSAGNVKLDLVDGTLLRSSGNLTLVSGVAAAELLGIADLTLAGNALANRLTGNRGDNVLTGLDGSDLLSGGIGNDTLYGGNNYDTVDGGDGDDQAWGGNGRDLIILGNGNDIFWDNGQNDANGHDTVWGGAGNDTVNGGGGNELIYGEAGADSLLGGIGNDTLYAGDNYDTVRGGDGDDQAWGGNGRDLIFLGTGNDIFWDNAQADANGHDTVYGGAGNDTVNGGGGNELIYGEAGSDSLLGGIGNDTISAGDNYDTVRGGDGNDQVWGGNGRDLIFLGTGDDVFWDNGQNDVNGHDTVYGGAGNDTVNGGGGNELIFGEAGNDSLIGGIGNDTLWGGADADRFVFATGCGSDRVGDFQNGVDLLRITAGAADFSAVTVTAQGADTLVQFADISILLAGVDSSLVEANDFIFG